MRVDYRAPREDKRRVRTDKVGRIVVTVMRGDTALRFDGGEKSQMRLLIRSQRMRATGQQTRRWTMADNVPMEVTLEEMEQALDLAIAQQDALWDL